MGIPPFVRNSIVWIDILFLDKLMEDDRLEAELGFQQLVTRSASTKVLCVVGTYIIERKESMHRPRLFLYY